MSEQPAAGAQYSSDPPRRRGLLRGFPLAISERKAILATLDIVLVNLSLLVAGYLLPVLPSGFGVLRSHLVWFGALSIIWLVCALAFDCYDLKTASQAYSSLFNTERALIATTLVYLFVPYVIPSRRMLFFFFMLASVLVSTWRLAYVGILSQPSFRRRAVVVGAGWAGRTITAAIHQNLDSGYELVGYIDDDPEKRGQVIEGLPVIGTRDDLVSIVEQSGADEVILAITHNVHEDLLRGTMDCYEHGARVSLMPILYEAITGRVPVEHVGPHWHVALPPGDVAVARVDILLKRLMDILAALTGLVFLGILIPFIGLALFLESRGAIFRRDARVGKGGRVFHLVSFHTTLPESSRLTRVGRILRITRLDKLPQAINILRGDMSLIGPRPEAPDTVRNLEQLIPFYRARQAVRPGLTGWAQVKYRYGSSVEDSLAKLQFDLYYIKHQSFYLDVLIILQSFATIFNLQLPREMS